MLRIDELTDQALSMLQERLESLQSTDEDYTTHLIRITKAIAELSKERRGQKKDQVEKDEEMSFEEKERVVFDFALMLPLEHKVRLIGSLVAKMGPIEREALARSVEGFRLGD